MHKPLPMLLLPICALALCACAANGRNVKPVACPQVPPLPENLKQPLQAETRLRQLLFESGPSATQRNEN